MTQHSPLGIKAVLSASRISLDLGGSRVLDDVSTSFDSGLVTAVVGPNGAGKSSLIRLLAGIEAPSSGTLSWSTAPSSQGPGAITDWARMPRRERARTAALVEQDAHAELPLSVRAAVALGRTPHLPLLAGPTVFDETAITSALETASVAHFAARELLTLSGGERQRVHLARALAQQPSILLLDEPTNHLDIRAQLEVLALVRGFAERGLTVIAALHDLNLAMTFADRIVVLDEGRVVASGTPASVLTPDLIMEVWGVTAAVVAGSNRPVICFDLPAWEKRI